LPLDLSITRIALTNAKEERQAARDDTDEGSTHGTMGRKALVPYGLYRCSVFVSPQQAAATKFGNEDLALLWDALVRMWDFDRSAARGLMACRGLYVFTHENGYGNAPAHKLLDLVRVERRPGIIAPRSFADYTVTVDKEGVPDGVTLTTLEG
jgi:CRISPR-associated protein Csd2